MKNGSTKSKSKTMKQGTSARMNAIKNVAASLPKQAATYIDRLECLLKTNTPINVLVYGQVNHGKSSFLNAWIGKEQLFKTADVRTTVEIQKYEDKKHDIIWWDTPGLQADDADEKEANKAIKQADIVFLVHEAKSGELDTREIDFIDKYTHSIGANKVRLLLTKIDENKDEVETIITQIKNQISKYNIDIFPISSNRYSKGTREAKTVLIEKSGFSRLRTELNNIRQLIVRQRRDEQAALIADIRKMIAKARTKQEKIVSNYDAQILKKKEVFSADLDYLVSALN